MIDLHHILKNYYHIFANYRTKLSVLNNLLPDSTVIIVIIKHVKCKLQKWVSLYKNYWPMTNSQKLKSNFSHWVHRVLALQVQKSKQ